MIFYRLLIFFQRSFSKILSGIPLGCQAVWTQIRPDILTGLIWVQTVCKGYQQTTQVATSKEKSKVNNVYYLIFTVRNNLTSRQQTQNRQNQRRPQPPPLQPPLPPLPLPQTHLLPTLNLLYLLMLKKNWSQRMTRY